MVLNFKDRSRETIRNATNEEPIIAALEHDRVPMKVLSVYKISQRLVSKKQLHKYSWD